jgi:cell wall-associated NlpC family hydrolase
MSRITRASASRLCGRIGVVSLAFGVVAAAVFVPGTGRAVAEPVSPDGIATLVTAVANANQKLQDLGAAIQTQQESVNKALVGVQTARDAAAAAQQEVTASQAGLTDANTAIAAAQKRFDGFAASTYMNGPSASYVTATDPADIIDTAATGQALSVSSQQVITNLQRARTEQVNRESAARLAKQKADQAVVDAQTSQDSAVTALTQAQQTFGNQKTELDQLTAERSAAQAKLDKARLEWSAPAGRAVPQAVPAAVPAPAPAPAAADASANWDRDPAAAAPGNSKWDVGWDPTLPAIPSAFVSGDPIAIINQVLGIATTSAQATQQMGRGFLQKLGILPTPSGYTNGAIPRVYGRQASEYVIRRAGSQMGVPYSWGGGNAVGPSRGIDSGSGTTGFDCSGLILYAFAGVGIKLPHYSGAQYDMGRKIPASQMRRGDVIFYGPGGSQHVTLYLGNGQMLEAPYTGSTVKISPVRTSGMTPYVIRYIEY